MTHHVAIHIITGVYAFNFSHQMCTRVMKTDENHRKRRFTMVFANSSVNLKDFDRFCHIIWGLGGVFDPLICSDMF